MRIKNNSVSLIGLQPQMRLVLKYVDIVYESFGQEPVITAGTESTNDNKFIHSAGSYHPFGFALDFRTRYFTKDVIDEIVETLKINLGSEYDVIYEGNHLHIEFNYQ